MPAAQTKADLYDERRVRALEVERILNEVYGAPFNFLAPKTP